MTALTVRKGLTEMFRLSGLTICFAMLATSNVYADAIVVRAGEHGDFTRVTLDASFDMTYRVVGGVGNVAVELERVGGMSVSATDFDLTRAFSRIDRSRIREVSADSGTLTIWFECACVARSTVVEGLIVLDIVSILPVGRAVIPKTTVPLKLEPVNFPRLSGLVRMADDMAVGRGRRDDQELQPVGSRLAASPLIKQMSVHARSVPKTHDPVRLSDTDEADELCNEAGLAESILLSKPDDALHDALAWQGRILDENGSVDYHAIDALISSYLQSGFGAEALFIASTFRPDDVKRVEKFSSILDNRGAMYGAPVGAECGSVGKLYAVMFGSSGLTDPQAVQDIITLLSRMPSEKRQVILPAVVRSLNSLEHEAVVSTLVALFRSDMNRLHDPAVLNGSVEESPLSSQDGGMNDGRGRKAVGLDDYVGLSRHVGKEDPNSAAEEILTFLSSGNEQGEIADPFLIYEAEVVISGPIEGSLRNSLLRELVSALALAGLYERASEVADKEPIAGLRAFDALLDHRENQDVLLFLGAMRRSQVVWPPGRRADAASLLRASGMSKLAAIYDDAQGLQIKASPSADNSDGREDVSVELFGEEGRLRSGARDYNRRGLAAQNSSGLDVLARPNELVRSVSPLNISAEDDRNREEVTNARTHLTTKPSKMGAAERAMERAAWIQERALDIIDR
jgi:hypothetical protein